MPMFFGAHEPINVCKVVLSVTVKLAVALKLAACVDDRLLSGRLPDDDENWLTVTV